jgi:hypothetical protein
MMMSATHTMNVEFFVIIANNLPLLEACRSGK